MTVRQIEIVLQAAYEIEAKAASAPLFFASQADYDAHMRSVKMK